MDGPRPPARARDHRRVERAVWPSRAHRRPGPGRRDAGAVHAPLRRDHVLRPRAERSVRPVFRRCRLRRAGDGGHRRALRPGGQSLRARGVRPRQARLPSPHARRRPVHARRGLAHTGRHRAVGARPGGAGPPRHASSRLGGAALLPGPRAPRRLRPPARRATPASRLTPWPANGPRPEIWTATPNRKAAALCRHLDEWWAALWTFTRVEGVEPTNNVTEGALRPAVLWRKGRFGTDSEAGSRLPDRLLTMVATCRQLGRSLLAFLVAAGEATLQGSAAPSL